MFLGSDRGFKRWAPKVAGGKKSSHIRDSNSRPLVYRTSAQTTDISYFADRGLLLCIMYKYNVSIN